MMILVRKSLVVTVALFIALSLCLPSLAFAEEASPVVEISADGNAARIEGVDYAIDSFSRAQSGSNRPVNDVYEGYLYYVSDTKSNVTALATDSYVVVYVPESSASELGININNNKDRDNLKQMLISLDEVSAKGSTKISAIDDWRFTDEDEYTQEGVVFFFDKELAEGRVYAGVKGVDGSDVTVRSSADYLALGFADSARLIAADDAEIIAATTGIDAFVEFLADIDLSPLWVTLRTTGTAIIFIFILGLLAAYFTLNISPRAQDIFDSIFTIPMVLPPTVCGFLLLMALGNNSPVGKYFIDIGFPLITSWPAAVIAAIVVAFPLMYRSARGAFENLDANMLDAARTLGWSNRRIFFRLMLPLSWSSIAAGTVLAFARALGEFGATIILATNIIGVTRTIPIAIYYEWMGGNFEVALFWTVVVIIISFIVILFINLWSRRTTKYRRRAED